MDDANAPAANRANRRSGICWALAMSAEEKAAPKRQTRMVAVRPRVADHFTKSGQQTIWAIENALVLRPMIVGVAPNDCMCNGSVLRAMPSDKMSAKTDSKIGKIALGI